MQEEDGKSESRESEASTGVPKAATAEENKQRVDGHRPLNLRFRKAVEERIRLTQAGDVPEGVDACTDADATIQRGEFDVSEALDEYLAHIEDSMVKQVKNIHDTVHVLKRLVSYYQVWLARVSRNMWYGNVIISPLRYEWLRLQCWFRLMMLAQRIRDAAEKYDAVQNHIGVLDIQP